MLKNNLKGQDLSYPFLCIRHLRFLTKTVRFVLYDKKGYFGKTKWQKLGKQDNAKTTRKSENNKKTGKKIGQTTLAKKTGKS